MKTLYNSECQVCGTTIMTKYGRYAEGADIKPLGKPHNGNDSTDNVLCLCPNHHVMLDKSIFSVDKRMMLIGIVGSLKIANNHKLANSNLVFHHEHSYMKESK